MATREPNGNVEAAVLAEEARVRIDERPSAVLVNVACPVLDPVVDRILCLRVRVVRFAALARRDAPPELDDVLAMDADVAEVPGADPDVEAAIAQQARKEMRLEETSSEYRALRPKYVRQRRRPDAGELLGREPVRRREIVMLRPFPDEPADTLEILGQRGKLRFGPGRIREKARAAVPQHGLRRVVAGGAAANNAASSRAAAPPRSPTRARCSRRRRTLARFRPSRTASPRAGRRSGPFP